MKLWKQWLVLQVGEYSAWYFKQGQCIRNGELGNYLEWHLSMDVYFTNTIVHQVNRKVRNFNKLSMTALCNHVKWLKRQSSPVVN